MRRIALFMLVLTLSGCGYQAWWRAPFVNTSNVNMPGGDSENMRRVEGQEPSVERITTEPGDIWPGPLAAPPTLQDIESSSGMKAQPEGAVPGSPLSRGTQGAPSPSPNPSVGSSTPPGNNQPGLATPTPAPPLSSANAPPAAPPARNPAGQVIQTPQGPSVSTGGGPGYQTTNSPNGQAIVVPNGNGTSTVIRSDGRIETIPTPK